MLAAEPAGVRETKFVFDAHMATHVLGFLHARCHPDRVHPTGIVSSVYYDMPDWQHLGEKLNGDYLKSKVRVRWYSDLATRRPVGNAFLELKVKIGALRHKLRLETDVPATRLAVIPLNSREMLRLPRLLRLEGVPLSGSLIPVFESSYARRRFVEPTTRARLSLDTDIRVSRTNGARLPHARPLPSRQAVFEMKGELDDLPASLADLRKLGCRKQAFSKYAVCLQLGRSGN